MKRATLLQVLGLFLLVGLSACKWKPDVTPVPITPPWSAMDLPVKENAVVWGSDATKFKAVHKDGRPLVSSAYILALTKAGWNQTKKDLGSSDYYTFEKGGEKLQLEIYDFHNTGVIIEKK